MLPLAVVQEIRRLLEEGRLSQRKIAAKLGVSRGTIGAIASGRRGIYGKEPGREAPDQACIELIAERCAGCGARVYKPCVLCRARAYRARQEQLSRTGGLPHRVHKTRQRVA